jgi:hypothetical protein
LVSLKKNKKMRKTQRLTESDIRRIVRKATKKDKRNLNESFMEAAMDIGKLVFVLVGLGAFGVNFLHNMIAKLRQEGNDEEADQIEGEMNKLDHGSDTDNDTDIDLDSDGPDFDFDFD